MPTRNMVYCCALFSVCLHIRMFAYVVFPISILVQAIFGSSRDSRAFVAHISSDETMGSGASAADNVKSAISLGAGAIAGVGTVVAAVGSLPVTGPLAIGTVAVAGTAGAVSTISTMANTKANLDSMCKK